MKDITQLFQQAADALDYQTPFLCTPDFNLYDSMSALDIMDPKMDDGCEVPLSHYISSTSMNEDILNKNTAAKESLSSSSSSSSELRVPPRPIPKHLKDPVSPLLWQDLNLSSVHIIVMELLIRFQSFMDGNSVADTIYTCYYLHDDILLDMERNLVHVHVEKQEEHVAQYTLYCASKLLIQLTSLVIQIVKKADIYEEEDFHMNLYGFTLDSYHGGRKEDNHGEGTDDDRTLRMQNLTSLYHTTLTMLESWKERSTSNYNDVHEHVHVVHPLLSVLEFLWNMYEYCDKLFHLTKNNVKTISNEIYNHTQLLSSSPLQRILKKVDDGYMSDTNVVRQCFDSYANRRKIGNTPVRKVHFQSIQSSLEYLDHIYQQMGSKVCYVLIHGNTLQRTYFILQRLSKESLNILIRSLIVLNLFFDDLLFGQENLALLIMEDMERFGVPCPLVMSSYGLDFIQTLCKPTYDTLKLMMLNRNRQNMFMDAVILKIWSNLQYDANLIDNYFQEEHELGPSMVPFATKYVIAKTAHMMEHYLSLGVELKLFHTHHQLMTAYWYLDFLQSTHRTMAVSMKQHLEERKVMELKISLEEANSNNTASHRDKKKKKHDQQNQAQIPTASPITPEDIEDTFYIQYLTVKQLLYRGIFRFLSSLEQTGLVTTPEYSFTSNELCFEKRFESFAQISQPPPLTFQDFQQGSDYSSIHPQILLSSTMDIFKDCKLLLSNLKKDLNTSFDMNYSPVSVEELNHMIKVCVTNSIHLFKLSQCIKDDLNTATTSQGTTDTTNPIIPENIYKVTFTVDPIAPFCLIQLE